MSKEKLSEVLLIRQLVGAYVGIKTAYLAAFPSFPTDTLQRTLRDLNQ